MDGPALLAADALGYVPPRLVTGGLTESDAQYLAHYSLSSVNLGYEVSGLSGITFLVNQLRLFGTRNWPADRSSGSTARNQNEPGVFKGRAPRSPAAARRSGRVAGL